MPYHNYPAVFRDASGEEIGHYHEALDEPTAPALEAPGAEVEIHFTPTTAENERYLAGLAVGAVGHARVEISTNGGVDWDDASDGIPTGTAGVDQEVLVRGVGLPFVGNDSDQSTFAFGVVASGEAGWLD